MQCSLPSSSYTHSKTPMISTLKSEMALMLILKVFYIYTEGTVCEDF